MPKQITASSNSAIDAPGIDVVTPLAARVLFWRPRYLENSDALNAVPLLFWLMDVLRPKCTVELGVSDGVSYFATCQAIDKLDLDARAYGFGAWDDGIAPDRLAAYNAENFDGIATLAGQDLQTAIARFPAASVDLLQVNAATGISDPMALLQIWQDRLSPRGVVLVHGANALLQDAKLTELLAQTPYFHLETGQGTLMLLCGDRPDERLVSLSEMKIGAPGYAAVHQIFTRLGSSLMAEAAARSEAAAARQSRAELQTMEQKLTELRQQAEDNQGALDKLQTIYEERNRQIAAVQSKLWDVEESRTSWQTERVHLKDQLTDLEIRLGNAGKVRPEDLDEEKALRRTLEEQLAEKDAALTKATAQNRENGAMITALQEELRRKKVTELAHLTQILEEKQTATDRLVENTEQKVLVEAAKRAKRLQGQHDENMGALTREKDEATKRMARLEHEISSLINSTSWKMMGPARKTILALRRLKP